MDNAHGSSRLQALLERESRLRRKIACISGTRALYFVRQLDAIKVEMLRAKETVAHADAGRDLSAGDPELQRQVRAQAELLEALERRANRWIAGWILVCTALGSLSLVMGFLFLGGTVQVPMQTPPMGDERVYLIVYYPSGLVMGDWACIRCKACRRDGRRPFKVTVYLEEDGRFIFEKDASSHEFDFSQPSSPPSQPWSTRIQYAEGDPWYRRLRQLVRREHINVGLSDENGVIAQECMPLQIVSLYVQIGQLAGALLTGLAAMLTLYFKLGKGLKQVVRWITAAFLNRKDG